jgi:aerobic C4-dicarboxylate transport protein
VATPLPIRLVSARGVATMVVAKWTGDLDTERLTSQLNQGSGAEADEPELVLDAKEAHMPAGSGR